MTAERELRTTRLPLGFQFSQGSLGDFVDCRRRFQLRYLWKLSWPAVESEPILEHEKFMRQGAAFHHRVQQYLEGVKLERLNAQSDDEILEEWWENFIKHAGFTQDKSLKGLFTEITLSAPLGDYRLVAKYDLLLFAEGRVTIVDWKTSRVRPRRERLGKRAQTRVYPYLLARAGAALNDSVPLAPDQIEMLYWFTNFPTEPMRFDYNQALYQADETYLFDLVNTIQGLDADSYFLTSDEKRCRFCVYRSLCDRGIEAGPLDDTEAEWEGDELAELSFDFEQIGEIEF